MSIYDVTSKIYKIGFRKVPCELPLDLAYIEDMFTSSVQKLDSIRSFIPCIDDFIKLRVKDDSFAPYVPRHRFNKYVRFDLPIMLSPYCGKYTEGDLRPIVNVNDRLYDWVYENRNDISVSREEIVGEYHRFISSIDLSKKVSN